MLNILYVVHCGDSRQHYAKHGKKNRTIARTPEHSSDRWIWPVIKSSSRGVILEYDGRVHLIIHPLFFASGMISSIVYLLHDHGDHTCS
jgi:hypothetical protein